MDQFVTNIGPTLMPVLSVANLDIRVSSDHKTPFYRLDTHDILQMLKFVTQKKSKKWEIGWILSTVEEMKSLS